MKFKWGFIGSGGICLTCAKQIIKGNHAVSAVYSRNEVNRNRFAESFNAKSCQSAEELFCSDIDAVYVGTPHSSHFEYAEQALKKGIAVLCEKPLTVDYATAEKLCALSKEKGVYLCEAMWTWFNPVAIEVEKWLKEGRVGEVKSFYASFEVPLLPFCKKDRLTNVKLGGGALLDLGVYPVTYCVRLLGVPQSVSAKGVVKNGVDYSTAVTFGYANDVTAQLRCSMTKLRAEKCVIIGEKGKIVVKPFHCATRATLFSNGDKEVFNDDKNALLYLRQFDRVAEEIKKGNAESEFVPQSQTLAVMKLLDEIRRIVGVDYSLD